jgi:hypothetical protein
MKKIIILILSVVLLGLLTWYAIGLMDNQGKSDSELIEFNIEDTSTVDRIIITDAFSNKIEIVRDGKVWTDAEGGCIAQENANFILDAFKNIEFKGYLADNSHNQFIKLMSTQNTKVEIFQDGEWTKTWYIGPAAQDHYGQVMLLDSDEYGKSDIPVMMKIKGVNGIIEPRFFADKRKWMCTNIFAVPLERISSVEVKVFDDPIRSFKVTKSGNKMDVYQQSKKLQNVDTAMIFRYLQNFKKIHYDLANFELSKKQVDSMKRTMPFSTLTLKETDGKTTKLRMFRIKAQESDVQTNEFGEIVDVDMNKFWCELPNGEMVKCQYFVFNPILLGHIYFPMNLDGRKKM